MRRVPWTAARFMTCIFPENHDRSVGASSQPGRRGPTDRRRVPTGPMDAFRFSGRRQRVRRGAEREGPFFTDRFDALILGIIVAVLVLCIVDGVLTIELLDVNSEEANPVMRFLLDRAGWPQGIAPLGLPRDPYVPFQAYGSSRHELAAGRYTEWITTGGGSGYRLSIR